MATSRRSDWSRVAGHKDAMYLPFWRIETHADAIELQTFADFLSWTNQPVVIRPEHRQRQLAFIVPAFKVNPSVFLRSNRLPKT